MVFVTNVASGIIFLPSVLRRPFGAIFFALCEICLVDKNFQI